MAQQVSRSADLPSSPRASIEIRGLSKVFQRPSGEEVRAVDDVDLDVQAGELLVLLGPSGCGKTTLLRSLAGLETPDAGRITIEDVEVFNASQGQNLPTHRRPLNMIFQSYALWPHMTALQNVEYPLKNRGASAAEARERALSSLRMVSVEEVAHEYPGRMSGGQQQRVALARAVVGGDRAILFDEPLSNVDAKVRAHLRLEILRMQNELGFTAIYVTHDQEEALTLGTRIAVLREGKVEQLGTPEEVYRKPVSRYVASFVGSINELPAHVSSSESGMIEVECAFGEIISSQVEDVELDDRVVAMIRHEDLKISPVRESTGHTNSFVGEIENALFLGGSRTEYVVRVGETRLEVWIHGGDLLPAGTDVTVSVAPADVYVFPRD